MGPAVSGPPAVGGPPDPAPAMPLSDTCLEALRVILLARRFLLEDLLSGGIGVERMFLIEFLYWDFRVLSKQEYEHLFMELLD